MLMSGVQLELSLKNGRACRSANLRHRRRGRRHEWFERMRQVVESAQDREPEPQSVEASKTPNR
jgi:hypothetical protein